VKVNYAGTGLRILDLDIECRPLSYLGQDYTTAEITAIATCWVVNGKPRDVKCWLLGEVESWDFLEMFRERYDQADMVSGHFLRAFDLPVINGAMLDNGLPPLSSKLASDTKLDLKKRKYISASQENLSAHLGVKAPKIGMSQVDWRKANRLTPEGIALTKKRVVGDIRQHVALRERLLQLGWLSRPKVWQSGSVNAARYTP
jgi:hypothetical protein